MQTTRKMGVIALLVSSLAVSSSAHALSFTTFVDETAFRSAAGTLSTETFNSFTVDTSFRNGTVNLTDFSLTGIGNITNNIIDVPPLVFPVVNIDGTQLVLRVTCGSTGFNVTFNAPITAFGATFNSTSDDGLTRLQVGADTFGNITSITQGNTEFYGFIADGNFTTLTFNSPNAGLDGFGADNFLYTSAATPVPFEFSPALGLDVLGTVWLGHRVLKKKKFK